MNVSECVRAANTALQSYRLVRCGVCGVDTLSGGSVDFCSNCESVVGAESRAMESGNPAISQSLSAIRAGVLRNDFEAASAAYDLLLKDRQSPQLLYAKGILYIEYSNFTVSQIRYDGEGFMERNAELRAKGSLLVSEAKRLISKSLSMSEKEAGEAPSAHAFYRMFLCDLKMGDLRDASERAGRIAELDKGGVVAAYAKIVLDVNGKLYKEAEKELEKLVRMKNPPANAFYYAAFNAFKLGDRKGAERIISSSGGLIEDVKRSNVLDAIREADSGA